MTPEETTAPAAEREPSPEFMAAIARFDAIDEDDPGNWAAGLAAAALMLLMASADEPGAGVLLAELTAVEVDRVAQAAVKLATLAAPAPPVDEPPAHRVDEEPGYVGDGEPEYGWRAGCACGEVVAGPDEEIADSLLRLHILEATNG